MTTSAKLGLELLQNNAANQTLANTTFAIIDQLCQAGVVDKDLSAPPGSPANGALYIVASSPTGAWVGKAGQLAFWLTTVGAWTFIVPREGFLVHVNDEDTFYKYNGTAWEILATGGSGTIAIEDEGTAEGNADTLNFTGAGVTVAVDTAGVATVNIPGGSSNATQSASSSGGVLDLSTTTAPVILVTLTENITSITLPSGVANQTVERRIVFTQGGAGTYTIPTTTGAWGSIVVDGGASIPQAGTGVGTVGVYVLANDNNGTWRMYLDQVSDMFAALASAEVSISAATTLTAAAFGKLHVCSGTSADYTVGLPAASGNAGKFIGFRMAPALTKLVTLDGNASELIDGLQTRIMWANETAILMCDGTAWTKIAGKSVPMACEMYPVSALSVADSVNTKVPLEYTVKDNTGAMADPTTNKRVNVKRPGIYRVQGIVYYQPGTQTMLNNHARLHINGTLAPLGANIATLDVPAGDAYFNQHDVELTAAAGDYIELYAFHTSTSSASRDLYVNSAAFSYLAVVEKTTW